MFGRFVIAIMDECTVYELLDDVDLLGENYAQMVNVRSKLHRFIIPAVEGDKLYAVLETERRGVIQVT